MVEKRKNGGMSNIKRRVSYQMYAILREEGRRGFGKKLLTLKKKKKGLLVTRPEREKESEKERKRERKQPGT
jgi:hypothetical protein